METPTTSPTDEHETIQREILRRVAAGELSPNDAAELLAELDRQKGAPTGAEGTAGGPQTAGGDGEPGGPAGGAGRAFGPGTGPGGGTGDRRSAPLSTVRINATFRSVQVIGDSSVAEAAVVEGGHHSVRREGDALIIDIENEEETGGYSFAGRGAARARLWAAGVGQHRLRQVVIRANPELALNAELAAGTLSILGVRGPIRARVSAGSLRVEGFAAPLDIAVSAGSVTARGVLDHGDSEIECDAGKVRLVLEPGSNVRVQARADLGKVDIHGAGEDGSSEWLLGGGHDATIGTGAASLKIRASMGAVQVVAP